MAFAAAPSAKTVPRMAAAAGTETGSPVGLLPEKRSMTVGKACQPPTEELAKTGRSAHFGRS